MISEVESNDLAESRDQSGGPLLTENGSCGMWGGDQALAPAGTPLSQLQKKAHASSAEGAQSKPGEAGTIVASVTDAGCVGRSLCCLDSENLASAAGMRPVDGAALVVGPVVRGDTAQ